MLNKELLETYKELSDAIILSGKVMPEHSRIEIAAILFAASLNKNENKPIDFSKEGDFAKYLSRCNKAKEIDINQAVGMVRVYDQNIQDAYLKLIKLSDEVIVDLFEYNYEKVYYDYGHSIGTTKEVADLVFKLLQNNKYKSIVDVCSGGGTILTTAFDNGFSKLNGYEINTDNITIAKMRATIHGTEFNIETCDVLQKEISEKFDVAFTDPPFGLRTFKATVKDKDDTLQYKDSEKTTRADWHYIFKALNSTNKKGKTFALIPDGVLFNTPDAFYRKQIIDNDRLEAVISLPQGIINDVGVKVSLVIFSEKNSVIKFVEASDCYTNVNTYRRKLDVENICKLFFSNDEAKVVEVNKDTIIRSDYALNAVRYIVGDLSKEVKFPATLIDYADIIPGFQYKISDELEPGAGEVSIVKISNVLNGAIEYDNLVSINPGEKKIDKYYLKENDILISTKGTAIKFAIVEHIGDKKLVAHNNMSVIRCKEGLDPTYLICFLKSKLGTSLLMSKQTGAIIMNITQKAIENLTISKPDSDTQKVIANRYRILLRDIAKIKEQLVAAEAKISTIWEDEVGE